MGRVPASPYDREASDIMSRRDVLMDPTETRVEVARVTTDVIVELIDVETIYFYITSAQTTPEHRVVNGE